MKTRINRQTTQGNVLLICLCIAVVIGIGVASCLKLVEHQNLMVARSQSWNSSLVMAEAGVEDGMALINIKAGTLDNPSSWTNSAGLDHWSQSGNVYHIRRYLKSDHYDVYITNVNDHPVIRAVGTRIWNSPSGGSTPLTRCVVVKTIPASLYQGGIVAKEGAVISGNALIDSFNSQNTNYSTGGRYDPAKRKDSGNVATTQSNVVAAVAVGGSVLIYGKIYTGPNSTVQIKGNNVSVGSTSWVPTSGVQTNWVRNDLNVTIQDAPPPPAGLPMPLMQDNTVNGTNYDDSILLSGNENYQSVNNISLSSSQSIIVDGNVNLYLQDGLSMSGQSFVYITPGSKLTLYSDGPVSLGGGGVVNGTGYATNLTVYGTPSCDSISYSGGSDFVGTIYAPEAAFTMTGGGSTIYNLIGSVVANSVKINGNYQIHYDESLQQPPVGANYYVASWKEVPP